MSSKNKSKKAIPATQTFISFSDVVSTVSSDASPPNSNQKKYLEGVFLQPVYVGNDSELAAACKQVFKKDAITRAKALLSIRSILEDRGSQVISGFLSHFIYIYIRIVLENQRQIVECLNSILYQLLIISRPSFKPYMKDLIGQWWIFTNDIYIKSSEIASEAFEKAFPGDKKNQALHTFSKSIIDAIQNNLALDKNSIDTTEENADEYLERVYSVSLSSLSTFISHLPDEASTQESPLMSSIFWTKWLSSPSASIRRQVYMLLQTTSALTPFSAAALEQVSRALSKSLMDPHSPNSAAALDAFTALAKSHPNIFINYSIDKHLLPALRRLINSDPRTAFSVLLPVLASIPEHKVSVDGDSALAVIELLRHIINGMNEGKISPQLTLEGSVCVLESSCFILLRKTFNISTPPSDSSLAVSLLGTILDGLVFMLEAMISQSCTEDSWNSTCSHISKLLGKLHTASVRSSLYSVDCSEELWRPLSNQLLARASADPEASSSFLQRATSLLQLTLHDFVVVEGDNGLVIVLQALLTCAEDKITDSGCSFGGTLQWTAVAAALNTELPSACSTLGYSPSRVSTLISGIWDLPFAFQSNTHTEIERKLFDSTLICLSKYETLLTNDELAEFKSKLTNSLFQSKSLFYIVSFLESDYSRSFPLQSTQLSHIDALFTNVLANKNTEEKELQHIFILLCLTRSQYFPCDQYEIAILEKWKTSKASLCLWTLLSFSMRSLSLHLPLSTYLQDILEDVLIHAFFSRTRESNRSNKAIHKNDLMLILSWNDIKSYLLPLLSNANIDSFMSRIAQELRMRLLSTATVQFNDVNDDNDDNKMQPKKYARHICGLLSLVQGSASIAGSRLHVLEKIGLVDTNVWKLESVSLSYVKQSLLHISEMWEDSTEFLWECFLTSADRYIDTYFLLNSIGDGIILNSIHKLIWSMDSKKQCVLLLGVLKSLSDKLINSKSLVMNDSSINGILRDLLQVKSKKSTRGSSICILDCPISTDILLKDSKVWYLRTIGTSYDGDNNRAGIQSVEASIVQVDRQASERPFYTIIYRVTGNVDVEVQTESHRLLLSPPSGNFDAINSIEDSTLLDDDSDKWMILARWITSSATELTNNWRSDTSGSLLMIQAGFNIFGLMAEDNNSCGHIFQNIIAPPIRQTILATLSKDFLSNSDEIFLVFSLFQMLISCKLGRGNLLWVPQVIEYLKRIALSVHASSRLVVSASEKVKFVTEIVSAFSTVLDHVQSRDTVDTLLLLLPTLIASLSEESTPTNVKRCIVSCFGHVWESRSIVYGMRLQTKAGPKMSPGAAAESRFSKTIPYETIVFDLSIELLCDSRYCSQDKLIACKTLHYCYCNLDRNDSKELLSGSKIHLYEHVLLRYLSDSVEDPVVRLFAAKTLDIFYLSKEFGLLETILDDPIDEHDVSEEAEYEKDRAIYLSIVGETLSSALQFRLSTVSKSSQSISVEKGLYGLVLEWLLCLQLIDVAAAKSFRFRYQAASYFKKSGLLNLMMLSILRAVPEQSKVSDVANSFNRMEFADENLYGNSKISNFSMLIMYCLFRTVYTLPAIVRSWWSDESTREQKSLLRAIIESSFSNSIASREVALISIAASEGKWTRDEMTVRGSAVSGEVLAVYLKDGVSIELKIKLPSAYPLLNVEVECSSKVGVSEARWKRWVLQIVQLLSMQDGSVVDAVMILKRNIDKEFDGVEPCPICYSILHPKSLALPSLACPTCSNKFHNQCLFTWFKSSGKSKCVICQQPFFL